MIQKPQGYEFKFRRFRSNPAEIPVQGPSLSGLNTYCFLYSPIALSSGKQHVSEPKHPWYGNGTAVFQLGKKTRLSMITICFSDRKLLYSVIRQPFTAYKHRSVDMTTIYASCRFQWSVLSLIQEVIIRLRLYLLLLQLSSGGESTNI